MKKILVILFVMNAVANIAFAAQNHQEIQKHEKSKYPFLSLLIKTVKKQRSAKSVRIQSPVSIIQGIENNNSIASIPSIDSINSSQQSLTDCHVSDPDSTRTTPTSSACDLVAFARKHCHVPDPDSTRTTPASSISDLSVFARQHCSVPDCGSPNSSTPPCTPPTAYNLYSNSLQFSPAAIMRKRSISDGYEEGFFIEELDIQTEVY